MVSLAREGGVSHPGVGVGREEHSVNIPSEMPPPLPRSPWSGHWTSRTSPFQITQVRKTAAICHLVDWLPVTPAISYTYQVATFCKALYWVW